jgi:probable addiction module antidote protein
MDLKAENDQISNFATDESAIGKLLTDALAKGDVAEFQRALGAAVQAVGVQAICKMAALSRRKIKKSVTPECTLSFQTARTIINALGLKIEFALSEPPS